MGNPSLIEMVFAFLLVLGPLILLHELGHFLAAKRAGIRALEFGMGYPPRARKLWRGTGYVVVDGAREIAHFDGRTGRLLALAKSQ